MIGKPEWFERRKYGGWGIHPKTWQGWVYIAILLIPFIIFQALPYWDDITRTYVTLGWLAFLLFDTIHIMITLRRDEREEKIEALSDRNAAWFMVMALVLGILYQVISSALTQTLKIDWVLFAALIGGAIVKTASDIYYDKKGF